MRTSLRPQPAHAWLQVCGVAFACVWLHGSEQVTKPDTWPRVHIEDAFTRIAVEWALTGAAQWLASERCRGVLMEFRDAQNRTLAGRLDALGVDAPSYLKLILFRDGSQDPHCAGETTFAVTTPGGRVVFVCGRRFERAWRASATHVQAILLHEALHTLGLGENPPMSRDITHRILALCDGSEKQPDEPFQPDDRTNRTAAGRSSSRIVLSAGVDRRHRGPPYAYLSRIRGMRYSLNTESKS